MLIHIKLQVAIFLLCSPDGISIIIGSSSFGSLYKQSLLVFSSTRIATLEYDETFNLERESFPIHIE